MHWPGPDWLKTAGPFRLVGTIPTSTHTTFCNQLQTQAKEKPNYYPFEAITEGKASREILLHSRTSSERIGYFSEIYHCIQSRYSLQKKSISISQPLRNGAP